MILNVPSAPLRTKQYALMIQLLFAVTVKNLFLVTTISTVCLLAPWVTTPLGSINVSSVSLTV